MKRIIYIEGMTCEGCVSRVKKALQDLPGVENVDVNLDSGRAIVTGSEEGLKEDKLKNRVIKLGYEVKGVD